MNPATLSDLLGALAFGLFFLPLLGLAEWIRRRDWGRPEISRKIVHVGGGLLSLALPWLVRSPLVVFVMSALLALTFVWAQRHAALRSLHGVSRRTHGTAYFPVAVFMVYLLAADRYWLYVCALLVLAVADSCAALIGTSYGRLRYEIDDTSKSVEGSLVFLLLAFLALHLPMLLLTDLPRAVCVLAALLVAVLVTGFEAVSLGGADNLFIPLGVAVILAKITTKPVPEIAYQNLSLLLLGTILMVSARRARAFNAGGAVMFALFTYGAWSLGSERWALPILSGFLVYAVTRQGLRARDARDPESVRPRILFRVLVIPLLLLVTGNMVHQGARFYAPFVIALAAVLAGGLWSHVVWARAPSLAARRLLAPLIGLGAWAAVAVPVWACLPDRSGRAWLPFGAGFVALSAVIDDRCMPPEPVFTGDDLWPARRLLLAAGAAATVLLAQRLGWLTPWRY